MFGGKVMKKCAIILSHCNTDEKKKVLLETIDELRKVDNLDIVLTSHIPIDPEIVEKSDYFIYDKENPILEYPERVFFNFWQYPYGDKNDIKLIYLSPDYGYGPFNQIKLGYFASLNKHYDHYYIVNYDLVIDETILKIIKEDERSLYFSGLVSDGKEITPSMIFMSLSDRHMKNIVHRIQKSEYIRYDMAEGYMKYLLEILDITKYPDYLLKDKINANDDVSTNLDLRFDFSLDDRFTYFFGSSDLSRYKTNEKERHYFKIIKEDIKIKTPSGETIELEKGKDYIIDAEGDMKIYNNGEYVDLKLRYNGGTPRQVIELLPKNE